MSFCIDCPYQFEKKKTICKKCPSSNIVQQSLSGSEHKGSTPKCQKDCTSYETQTNCGYCLRAEENEQMADYYESF